MAFCAWWWGEDYYYYSGNWSFFWNWTSTPTDHGIDWWGYHATVPAHRWGYNAWYRSGGTGAPVALHAVTAYDPYGRPPGLEHNADAHYATDASADTYWETERYISSFAAMGKLGVGLVLDAGRPVQLQQLGLVTQTPGFTAVIRGGDSASGPFPDTLSASQRASGQAKR